MGVKRRSLTGRRRMIGRNPSQRTRSGRSGMTGRRDGNLIPNPRVGPRVTRVIGKRLTPVIGRRVTPVIGERVIGIRIGIKIGVKIGIKTMIGPSGPRSGMVTIKTMNGGRIGENHGDMRPKQPITVRIMMEEGWGKKW